MRCPKDGGSDSGGHVGPDAGADVPVVAPANVPVFGGVTAVAPAER